MTSTRLENLKKFIMPGIIFQSVIIAGGYGTGREIVESFVSSGTIGGFLAMVCITGLVWAVVCAATFEFARVFKAYDYRTFFQNLLGRAWWLYEICYLVLLLIVLAVIASSAGSILNELFGISYYIGVGIVLVGVGLLVTKGTETIEKILSLWSFALYGMYILFVILVFSKYGNNIINSFATGTIEKGWALNGFKYAFYNLGIIPAVLFSVRHVETRKEAIGAGIVAGIMGIIPAILLFIAMAGFYPDIIAETVPTVHILNAIGTPGLQIGFQIILFGTLIETGTGFIFAVTERVSAVYSEKNKKMPNAVTLGITLTLLIAGAFISRVGLIDLIAKGYGTITWGFFIFYVVPVLTIGIIKVQKTRELS